MKILIIDDDIQLADIVAFALRRDGFLVRQVHHGLAGLKTWEIEQPDLVVLDAEMPGLDGFEVCRRIRARAKTPILMLITDNSDGNDHVRCRDVGADDYLTKPFSPRTLLARVRALLHCASLPASTDWVASELMLDPYQHAVRLNTGKAITLTPMEYRMLHYLMLNQGQILPADSLIDHVWGYHDGGDRALLKQLIRRLRLKIEPDPAQPRYILTVPGIGYKLSIPRHLPGPSYPKNSIDNS